jgi:hypothetical protein
MKPMTYRQSCLIRNALKLTYGSLGTNKFPEEETTGPLLKVEIHPSGPAEDPGYAYTTRSVLFFLGDDGEFLNQ